MGFSILGLINKLTPKDKASVKRASDVPYGADPRQKLDIYAPKAQAGPCPVVFFVYGGSWMDGDRHHYDFAGRALAALGYVTVIADYRLLPQTEYPGFIKDGAAAFDFVANHIAEHGGDPHRIALMGHSAGAYNAVMLALDPAYLIALGHADRVKCVIGLSGPYDFLPFDGPITLRTFGAVTEPKATQPVNLVTRAAPPMFLATGDADRLVLPRNTVALAARLRAAGVAVEEVHYPSLGHPAPLLALMQPLRGMAPVLKDVAAYLDRHL